MVHNATSRAEQIIASRSEERVFIRACVFVCGCVCVCACWKRNSLLSTTNTSEEGGVGWSLLAYDCCCEILASRAAMSFSNLSIRYLLGCHNKEQEWRETGS